MSSYVKTVGDQQQQQHRSSISQKQKGSGLCIAYRHDPCLCCCVLNVGLMVVYKHNKPGYDQSRPLPQFTPGQVVSLLGKPSWPDNAWVKLSERGLYRDPVSLGHLATWRPGGSAPLWPVAQDSRAGIHHTCTEVIIQYQDKDPFGGGRSQFIPPRRKQPPVSSSRPVCARATEK